MRKNQMKDICETSRMKFTRLDESDLDFLLEYHSCPELTKYLPLEKPYPKEKVVNYLANRIKHWINHNFGTYLLTSKETNEKIGYSGLEYVGETNYIDIRFGIIKEYWGKGLATEAAKTCINNGFDKHHLNIIYGAAVSNNIGSITTLKKIGMKQTNKVDFYGNVVDYLYMKNKNS
jgi:[ribosomal protein S5]-alanine N-acetyltransferase